MQVVHGGGRGGGGRGGSLGRSGGGGLGNKSAMTKQADRARVAALLAQRKEVERAGGSWDPMLGCARDNVLAGPAEPVEPEVECMGASTRAEAEAGRDAARRDVDVVDLDSEDEAVGGGPATAGALEGISSQLSFSEFSQDA